MYFFYRNRRINYRYIYYRFLNSNYFHRYHCIIFFSKTNLFAPYYCSSRIYPRCTGRCYCGRDSGKDHSSK